MSMRLIKQTNGFNCAAACLAMIADLDSVEAAEQLIGRRADSPLPGLERPDLKNGCVGHLDIEICRALFELGIPHVPVIFHERYAGTEDAYIASHHRHLCLPGLEYLLLHLDAGARAILTVRSKNYPEYFHAIALEGHEVYDPSSALCYTSADFPVPISAALLIRPAQDRRIAA